MKDSAKPPLSTIKCLSRSTLELRMKPFHEPPPLVPERPARLKYSERSTLNVAPRCLVFLRVLCFHGNASRQIDFLFPSQFSSFLPSLSPFPSVSTLPFLLFALSASLFLSRPQLYKQCHEIPGLFMCCLSPLVK